MAMVALLLTSLLIAISPVVAAPAGAQANPTNLALGATATQSSTAFGGVASRAVDGNTDGRWSQNSITATTQSSQPWWQVDLGTQYDVAEVRVWNRNDCCSERLANFYVFVSSTDMTGMTVQQLRADASVSAAYHRGDAEPFAFTSVGLRGTGATGRYVRVQLVAPTEILSLAEVQVFGTPPVPNDYPSNQVTPAAGVVDVDPNAVTQSLAEEALVWDIEVIGNTVYVAGTFLNVAEKYDGQRHAQSYVAAFDASSGNWIDWWTPQLEGPAYALDTTSDGALLVGGEFTSVDGDPKRSGLVALDPLTGEIDTRFTAKVERRWTTDPMVVRDISTANNRVYIAGNFNGVNGVQVTKVARVDRTTGVTDPAFAPLVTGNSAFGIVESADGQRVHIGGWFSEVNGVADTDTLATVHASDGTIVAGWNHGFPGRYRIVWQPTGGIVLDLDIHGDDLYVAGAEHFWVRMSSTTGDTQQLYSSQHDTQSVNVIGDRVFVGCHCRLSPKFWSYQIDATNGHVLHSYTDGWTGDDGSWAVGVAPDNCVWTGGGLDSAPSINGGTAWLGNLARSCPVAGPTPHNVPSLVEPPTLTCSVVANANGSATISWVDIGATGYDLAHDGGPAQWITNTTFTDFTPGTDYTITAWGGGVGGTTTSCTNPNPGGGGWTCSVVANANGSATITWSDIGATGYDLAHDGGPAQWITNTTFTDFTPGTDYTITAWGGGVGGTTTSCTNPNPGGGGGYSCSATNNGDGTVTITWTGIGANGYDVSHDGGAARWVTATTYVDSTPGSNYTVTAWGNGVGGTTTTCAV